MFFAELAVRHGLRRVQDAPPEFDPERKRGTKIEAGRMAERIFTVPIESRCNSTSGKEWTWAGLSPS